MRLLVLLVAILLPVCNIAFVLNKHLVSLPSTSSNGKVTELDDRWQVVTAMPKKTFLRQSFYSGGGGGDRRYGGDRRSGGRGGYNRGYRGGRGGSRSRPPQNQPLRFTKTIKIDPELRTSVDEMDFSDNTLRVLKDKGFETLTPVQVI